jgi:S-adenosylmethionine decarboxylase
MEKTARVRNVGPVERPDESAPNERMRASADQARHQVVRIGPHGPAAGLDHFVERGGLRFAGTHLILDLWQASHLDDIATIEAALRKAAEAAAATLLKIDLHSFAPTGGVTGVAVLAESHISIHTWPERAYAAVDVFMCGNADPHKALDVLRRTFVPGMLTVTEHKRGVMS